ncbi:MAG: hypothetical protein KKA19_09865 [Candidatus Margulisbacteria bacterium]|nr:hypothetical protein [Candidatus Margulisiibacteriota bacterium]
MKINKYLLIFLVGLIEQFGYTLYLIAVGKYLMLASSVLMFMYFFVYLLIINYAIKDNKNTISLLLVYAFAAGVGNYIAMALRLIK